MTLRIPHGGRIIAGAYSRGFLPSRVASGLFWQVGPRDPYAKDLVVSKKLLVGARETAVRLPLRHRQNWTIFFDAADRSADAGALELFRTHAARSNCIFDIGMNVGLYLLAAVNAAPPTSRVFGFEPNTQLAEIVREHLRSASCQNAEVVEAAVSSTSGWGEFGIADNDLISTLEPEFVVDEGSGRSNTRVRLVSIDEFVMERDIKPDLMKIDVEGHEEDVIAGAHLTLSTHRPTLLLEISQRSVESPLPERLFGYGYSAYQLVKSRLDPLPDADALRQAHEDPVENYLFTGSAVPA